MRKGSIFLSLMFVFSWMLVLTVANVGTAFSEQVVFKAPIAVQISVDTRVDTLWCGVHGDGPGGVIIDNTYGTDVDIPTFGIYKETANPPDPLAFTWIAKWIQIPGRSALPPDGIYASGLKPLDIRGLTSSSTDVDTFQINVYGDGTDALVSTGTITFSWPNNLSNYATSWQLKRRVGANYVLVVENMATGDTLTYTDANAAGSNSTKYLIIVSGLVPIVGVEKTETLIPTKFDLQQNYPNPFNPTTVLNFSVAKKEMTSLKLYNTLGQEVMKLYDGVASPGTIYKATVDGSQLASGIYFYRLVSGTQSEIKKMVLLK